jgi:hypothetical protein
VIFAHPFPPDDYGVRRDGSEHTLQLTHIIVKIGAKGNPKGRRFEETAGAIQAFEERACLDSLRENLYFQTGQKSRVMTGESDE